MEDFLREIRTMDELLFDEEILTALIKSVSAAVFCAQPPYRIVFYTLNFLQLMGYRSAAIIRGKRRLTDFLPDEKNLSSLVGFGATSAEITAIPFKKRDGTVVICHVRARRLAGERIFLSLTDIDRVLVDGLTGLYNRYYFESVGKEMIELSRRRKGKAHLFLIDVNKMKDINQRFTHTGGDAALKFTAAAVKKVFGRRTADLVVRFGGDEFAALIISGKTNINTAGLLDRLKEEMKLGCPALGGECISLSVGTYFFRFMSHGGLFVPPLSAFIYEASLSLLQLKESG